MKRLLLLIFLFPTLSYAQDAEAIIRQNITNFSAHLVAGDIDALLDAYTSDARIFPHGEEILQGEAIRRYWTPNEKSKITFHRIMPEEIKILGNEAYDWGYYEGKSLTADGKEAYWKGKYVIIWKEVAPGEWKMYLDIWNRVPVK